MNSYMLYRLVLLPVTLSDPNYHKPPDFRHFVTCIAFYIFLVSGVIDFKFGR